MKTSLRWTINPHYWKVNTSKLSFTALRWNDESVYYTIASFFDDTESFKLCHRWYIIIYKDTAKLMILFQNWRIEFKVEFEIHIWRNFLNAKNKIKFIILQQKYYWIHDKKQKTNTHKSKDTSTHKIHHINITTSYIQDHHNPKNTHIIRNVDLRFIFCSNPISSQLTRTTSKEFT